jgi:hypothetical protein
VTGLEHALIAIGRELDVPATPELAARVAGRLEPRARSRRPVALVLAAVALVALATALAVPSARSSLLRFFHLGGITVERVETLPPAQEHPLTANLGPSVPVAEAEQRAGFAPLLPPGVNRVYENEGAILALLREHGRPVLLTEFGSGEYFKKAVGGQTSIQQVRVGADYGFWIDGARHVFQMPSGAPRMAGNVLVWTHGRLTLRLEGRLTRAQAIDLATRVTQ